MSAQVVHQVASWVLSYPHDEVLAALPELTSALGEQRPDPAVRELQAVLAWLAETPPEQLRNDYVETFDLSRSHALHLSYWTEGDTRRRGEVLAAFKQVYRDSGMVVRLDGELPDHLPVVLEFAALVDPQAGSALLQRYRASLEMLRFELEDHGSHWAGAVRAVCATLPGASPRNRTEAMALAGPVQPVETVGLEPYDPRLLPLAEGAR
ncbi:nitrate reductase molybdenum cofactor assembly chaperone [Aeromicrobium sp. 636]|uniref:Nitrate reductase molybdenum cofactor assembly chaperone n=1 Tax=Aeromicrobium senzhongii TaxID=2663859 RepID=A0A8I0EUW2_9ACTN|nr:MULTISPECIES: nitrate reductase molybdenum cofactor assembly chaperone [Aeromicrobium]MBC9225791.1 nitrate reductase molybdenum cofactor assembly chaperone [Aeromicrobium senzhongii]MCQ3997900.1 nitrate reductase molybdenum cofactor assembly chaperone [Aeromicrobium sp. 636]MTB87828.1 nitrate reductase molybdenum cofactor assembly chaperone [Aeromicrobium senzhongii]QNL95152.1 nitrate reductase molybdenum cofactor assembly chaperone [Aeromicrobium senzhongii]